MADTGWDKEKVELEQEIFEIRSQLEDSRRQLTDTSKANFELRNQLEKLECERNERVRQMHDLESTFDLSESQKSDFKRRCEALQNEKNNLGELLDRRSEEIQNLHDEIRGLKAEMKNLTMQKCEQQLKFDDLNSRELTLEHREKRWSQEKELLLQEKQWMYTQLKEREQQVQQLRKELNSKDLNFRSTIDCKDDELLNLTSTVTDLKDQNVKLTTRCEELNKKVKEISDGKVSSEEMYEKELACQTKLVQVYKQASEEAENKAEELMKALESVQQLFNEAKDSHFVMQEQLKVMENEYSNDVKEKGNTITELKDELEKANELLRSKHRVMLTDEEITALSPGAAAASKLIKSGYTLTQIYREHLKVVEELEQQKLESRRLEEYFRELVHDIETKAPALKQQQEEYFKALDIIDHLKAQLNGVSRDQERILSDKDTCLRQLTYTKAELERYQRDNGDLSAQVRELLHCIERIRKGDYGLPSRTPDGNLNSEDLFLYRSIDDLQATNQRLLSALREAEAKREEMVKAAQDAEMSKMKNELQTALRELEDIKQYREKQEKLLESVADQRDTYQRLLEDHSSKPTSDELYGDSGATSVEVSKALEKLNFEFETYRKQKGDTEKNLNDKIDKLQTSLTDARATNSKLNTEVQYQMERFKILQANVDSYKKEIKSLRERNEKYSAAVARHEMSVSNLTQELLTSREEMSRFKIENERLKDTIHASQLNENRLDQELQMLKKNSFNQQMLSSTLQELQTRLERTEAEQTFKLKLDVESLTRERNNLQETVKNMNEQNQKYVQSCHAKLSDLEGKLEDEQKRFSRLESHVVWTEQQLRLNEAKVVNYEEELKKLHSTYEDATAERYQKEAQQLQTRLNYLEIRYNESTKKVEELTNQLTRYESEIQQFRRLSDSLESGLIEQKKTGETEKSILGNQLIDLSNQLQQAVAEKENLAQRLLETERELHIARSSDSERTSTFNARVKTLENSLLDAQQELVAWKRKEQEIRMDLERESTTCAEFRQKFDDEFRSHMIKTAEVDSLRLEISTYVNRLTSAESTLFHLTAEANANTAQSQDKENLLVSETELWKQKFNDLQATNETLMDQIQTLSNSLSVLERFQTAGATGSAASVDFNLDESDVSACESASTESLMKVVQCLRDERRQAVEKLDANETELMKLRSRENILLSDINKLTADLEVANKEASVIGEVTAEKSRLLTKLASLESVQEAYKLLNNEKRDLELKIEDLESKLSKSEYQVIEFVGENETLKTNLSNLTKNYEDLHAELEQYMKRYNDLVEIRSQFDPEEISRLRTELSASLESLSMSNTRCKTFTDENLNLKSQLDSVFEDNEGLKLEIENLNKQLTNISNEAENSKKLLEQCKVIARKYKTAEATLMEKVKSLEEQLEIVKLENEKLLTDKESLENQIKSDESEDSNRKELSERLTSLSKAQSDLKQTIQQSAEKLLAVNSEKKNIETKCQQLEAARESLEQDLHEHKTRLNLLTNLHNRCDSKIGSLTEQNSQLLAEKANWEKQTSQEAKVSVIPKPTSVTVAAVMPTTAAERPGSDVMESRSKMTSIRTSRPPAVGRVQPLKTPRSTVTVSPHAVSSSPSFPDQSTSSSTVGSQASSMNIVSTSSSGVQSSVPHAVVLPIEPTLGDEPAGSENISSSSVVLIMEQPTNSEAAAYSTDPPSTSTKRRPSYLESTESKRLRTLSPEQVTTSDQPTNVGQEQEGDGIELVGSSADDDDVIALDDIVIREPESSGRDQHYGEMTSSVLAMPHPNVQQPTFYDLDDSRVPSTPTLVFPRGLEPDTGTAHVPQGRVGGQQQQYYMGGQQQQFYYPGQHVDVAPNQSYSIGSFGQQPGDSAVPSMSRVSFDLSGFFAGESSAGRNPNDNNLPVEIQQQPQPSGQGEELEGADIELIGLDMPEENEASSEAIAVEPEDAASGNESSNEPTTSQPPTSSNTNRRIKRTPIVWSGSDVLDASDVPSSSGSASGGSGRAPASRGRPATARRSRGARGGRYGGRQPPRI